MNEPNSNRSDRFKNIVFVSIDVETDGPIPGPHSMLQLGAVAFTFASGDTPIGSFSANLRTLCAAQPDPRTMAWWFKDPVNARVYAATRVDTQRPRVALGRFAAWVASLPGTPVCVAYPAGFDFMFLQWYLIRFRGESPFARPCLDVRSYASALLDLPPPAHTHVATDDAREQGMLFMRMLRTRDTAGIASSSGAVGDCVR